MEVWKEKTVSREPRQIVADLHLQICLKRPKSLQIMPLRIARNCALAAFTRRSRATLKYQRSFKVDRAKFPMLANFATFCCW
jgi:hypothetical protein